MKKILLVLSFIFSLVSMNLSAQAITEADAKGLLDKVVKLFESKKADEVYKMMMDPKGDLIKGELYAYVFDYSGKVLAHPDSNIMGKVLYSLKSPSPDPKQQGIAFVQIMIDKTKTSGGGEVEYFWNKPNLPKEKLFKKLTYYKKVPGVDAVVSVGRYLD